MKVDTILEYVEHRVAFCWGRFQPPHLGHAEVFKKLEREGKDGFFICTSQTQDPAKNPLDYATKCSFIRKIFPQYADRVLEDPAVKTIYEAIVAIYNRLGAAVAENTVLVFVGDPERCAQFGPGFQQYNGQQMRTGYYKFKNVITVENTDAADIRATDVRASVKEGDFDKFQQLTGSSGELAKSLFNAVLGGMNAPAPKPKAKKVKESLSPEEPDTKQQHGNYLPQSNVVQDIKDVAKSRRDELDKELQQQVKEAISGDDMAKIYANTHHDPKENPEMVDWIRKHDWGVKMLQPNELPDYEDDVYFDDPFHRVIDIDMSHVKWNMDRIRHNKRMDPIIKGPGKSIIDGNHRAQAARELKATIQAYVPMEKVDESISVDQLNKPTPTVKELAEKYRLTLPQMNHKLGKGIKVEFEHTTDVDVAREIALDHLGEDPLYYEKLAGIDLEGSLHPGGTVLLDKSTATHPDDVGAHFTHNMDREDDGQYQVLDEVSLKKIRGFENDPILDKTTLGWELEMIWPGHGGSDGEDEDFDSEPDYDMDESTSNSDVRGFRRDVENFFVGDHNSTRGVRNCLDTIIENFREWLRSDKWDEMEDDEDDISGKRGYLERNDGDEDKAFDEWRQDNEDEFFEEWTIDNDMENMLGVMRYADDNANGLDWPHWTEPEYHRREPEYSREDIRSMWARQFSDELRASGYKTVAWDYPDKNKDPNTFYFEPDGSLTPGDDTDGGIELTSAQMPFKQSLSLLERTIKWAKGEGAYTGAEYETGMHLNLSLPEQDMEGVDWVKLILLGGDNRVLHDFERWANGEFGWAKSALKYLKKNAASRELNRDEIMAAIRDGMQSEAMQIAKNMVSTDKYTSVHPKGSTPGGNFRYVEFRSAGGDTLNNIDKIKNAALQYARALKIASDPNAEKQEYAKKLYKLVAKSKSNLPGMEYLRQYAAGEIDAKTLKFQLIQAAKSRGQEPKAQVKGFKYELVNSKDPKERIIAIADSLQDAVPSLEAQARKKPDGQMSLSYYNVVLEPNENVYRVEAYVTPGGGADYVMTTIAPDKEAARKQAQARLGDDLYYKVGQFFSPDLGDLVVAVRGKETSRDSAEVAAAKGKFPQVSEPVQQDMENSEGNKVYKVKVRNRFDDKIYEVVVRAGGYWAAKEAFNQNNPPSVWDIEDQDEISSWEDYKTNVLGRPAADQAQDEPQSMFSRQNLGATNSSAGTYIIHYLPPQGNEQKTAYDANSETEARQMFIAQHPASYRIMSIEKQAAEQPAAQTARPEPQEPLRRWEVTLRGNHSGRETVEQVVARDSARVEQWATAEYPDSTIVRIAQDNDAQNESLFNTLMKGGDIIDEEEVDEVKMSPGALKSFSQTALAKSIRIGFEAEMFVPDLSSEDDEDGEWVPDLSVDSRINFRSGWEQLFRDWYLNGDWSDGSRSVDRAFERFFDGFNEWIGEQFREYIGTNEFDNQIIAWLEKNTNLDAEEIKEVLDSQEGRYWDSAYDNIYEKFMEEHNEFSDLKEFAEYEDINTFNDFCQWTSLSYPYMEREAGSGDFTYAELAKEFEKATGFPAKVNGRPDETTSVFKEDGSLQRYGSTRYADGSTKTIKPEIPGSYGPVEFAGAFKPLDEALQMLDKFFKWAGTIGAESNNSCGFHISASIPGHSVWENVDMLKFLLFLGDDKIISDFGRQNESYAKSTMAKTVAQLRGGNIDAAAALAQIKQGLNSNAAQFVKKEIMPKPSYLGGDRYISINFKDNYIELRSPGKLYFEKKDTIINTMLRIAQALAIASEPVEEKEYMKKIYKLLSVALPNQKDAISLFQKYSQGQITRSELKGQVKSYHDQKAMVQKPTKWQQAYRAQNPQNTNSGPPLEFLVADGDDGAVRTRHSTEAEAVRAALAWSTQHPDFPLRIQAAYDDTWDDVEDIGSVIDGRLSRIPTNRPTSTPVSEAKRQTKKKPKTIVDGALKTLIAKGRSEDEAIADLKKEIDKKFYTESEEISETLKKVKGKWALVSRQDPKKVLQYYHGSGHPSKDWVSKVERRVHSFSEADVMEDSLGNPKYIRYLDGELYITKHVKQRMSDPDPDRRIDRNLIRDMLVGVARDHGEELMNTKDKAVVIQKRDPKMRLGLSCIERPDGSKLYTLNTLHKTLRAKHDQQVLSIPESKKAQLPKVYIDMDGTIADFFGEWAKLDGKKHWKDFAHIEDALDLIRKHPTFWTNLPLLPHARELVNFVKENFGEYYILSKPLEKDPRCTPGKRAWIREHFADIPPADVLLTANKAQHAMSGEIANVLIDDYPENIDRWREAGGIGILYEPSKFAKVKKMLKGFLD